MKINEVFELPVNGASQIILNPHEIEPFTGYQEAAEHVAHAINNVDELADKLEALIKSSERGGSGPAGYYQAIADAKYALNAYRGAK